MPCALDLLLQGELVLRGKIRYSKSKFITLQCPGGSDTVACEDVFDSVVVFDTAEWKGVDGAPLPEAVSSVL